MYDKTKQSDQYQEDNTFKGAFKDYHYVCYGTVFEI